jgi:hypothetical protein
MVKRGTVEKELAEIKSELGLLQQQIGEIKKKLEGAFFPIEEVLRRRGLSFHKTNPTDNLLPPEDIPPAKEHQFYEMMKRYSFRIFLREIFTSSGSPSPSRSNRRRRFCSPETEEEYTHFLIGCGILKEGKQGYALSRKTVRNFGGTLEWFVAQVMEREFASSSLWGVRFDRLAAGGDYDVLSWVERNLVYLEVKSSPPKHIEGLEVGAFLDRTEALAPDLAVFLVDTELRMKDKLVVLFEEAWEARFAEGSRAIRRVFDETFIVQDHIFVTNSRPNLVTNIARILQGWLGQRGHRFTEVRDD